jgi:GTP-binding protein
LPADRTSASPRCLNAPHPTGATSPGTSNTPGRTQELNFFDSRRAAPLPAGRHAGYGFAKAPKDVVRKWRYLVNDYLRGRAVLKRALVLIDSRHGIKDIDRGVMTMLDEAAVSYHLVLTKADKNKASDLAQIRGRNGAGGA